MAIEFITPVGRLVQGSVSMEIKKDVATGEPVMDDKGEVVRECFMAIAFGKTDPGWPALHALFITAARADFPHLFDANGNCTHPRFAFKVQDGDGTNTEGKSVSGKTGFAGHWIVKMATRYLPRAFHMGKYDPAQQIPDASEVIKRGYYVRVAGTVRGNDVKPGDRAVPGLYVSPNLVELVSFGEVIASGPDAAAVFGGNAISGALPAGASATPRVAAMPALPGAAPAMFALALPVPVRFIMQPSAMGATREALQAQGWTDALLLQHGHMVKA